MNPAKIRLSAKEMELVTNAQWILTKNGIIQKAKQLLEGLQEEQRNLLQSTSYQLPEEILKPPAKISKGENYKGLPYLVLDYPRYFDKENVFAVRTMFWWGNFFSITLQLSGRYKKQREQKIIQSFSLLASNEAFICVNDTEWEHHFEKDNYRPIREMDQKEFEYCITQKPFVKLAQKIPLPQWDEVPKILSNCFSQLMLLCADQLPSR